MYLVSVIEFRPLSHGNLSTFGSRNPERPRLMAAAPRMVTEMFLGRNIRFKAVKVVVRIKFERRSQKR